MIQAVEDMGKLDNTLIIYISGDNGTSAEGTLEGAHVIANGRRGVDVQWRAEALRKPAQRDAITMQNRFCGPAPQQPFADLLIGKGRRAARAPVSGAIHFRFPKPPFTRMATTV